MRRFMTLRTVGLVFKTKLHEGGSFFGDHLPFRWVSLGLSQQPAACFLTVFAKSLSICNTNKNHDGGQSRGFISLDTR